MHRQRSLLKIQSITTFVVISHWRTEGNELLDVISFAVRSADGGQAKISSERLDDRRGQAARCQVEDDMRRRSGVDRFVVDAANW